ncbi:TonB-dependent receptor [Allosphingosinicella deserti]|uniref:TonB-dependent receptor n=1 Tax=Allosphingosinicella deserti TaxID=2116704 RepID=A0A2P7QVV4_9SPHN|nr:TonB-dependent receptor [Sphingomonas deserti]PSJ42097.1 TonB-dependent receptor [Sphingomonas deserti]
MKIERYLSTASLIVAGISTATAAQAQPRSFQIPSQSAATGIPEFARQAGIQIIAPDGMRDRTIPEIRGTMTTRQGIDRLAGALGMEVARDDGKTVVLRPSATVAAVAAESGAEPGAQEEILVTAQRRRERGQDVPVSLTALGRDVIERQRINQLEDLSRVTPNLLVSSFSPGRPILAIRGATNTFNQVGVDKPVGVFVDDVYIPRNSAATLELFGIDSVQVLRGPQGTLFGRNVTGGAIVIDTGRPNFETPRARLRASYGEYDTRDLDVQADLPLAAGAAFRVAGLLRRHDGWGRDRLTGQELDDQDSKAGRAQLRLRLAEGAELLLGGDYASDRSGGRALSSIGVGDDGNSRTAEVGVWQAFRRKQGGASARLLLDTPIGEVTSITAWRRSRSTDIFSNVGANFRFLPSSSQLISDDRDRVTTFSQEVRLASPTWSRGNFLIGAYFFDEHAERTLGTIARAARTGALVTNQLADQQVDGRSLAIFADGTINLTRGLSLALGGRYTWDRKRASLDRIDRIVPSGNFQASDLTADWGRFTPRAVLRYAPKRELMLYASYSKGYTAGGYNTEAAVLTALTTPFEPETVDNFEAGFKSEWLDRHVRLNATAFRMEYRNKQELFFNNQTRILNINNAGRATIKGIEAELAISPVPEVTLSANYGLLDTRYDEFVIPGGAVYTGNRLGSAPHDKVSLALDVDVPVGRARVFGNLLYSFTGTYNTGAAADPGLVVNGYDIVNGTIGVGLGEGVEVAAFVRNLFNTDYVLIPSTQTVRAEYLGAPRTAGASLTLRF